MKEMTIKVKEIWGKMNESEKYGCQFSLFPAWVLEYKLTTDETVELMEAGKPNINDKEAEKNAV